ncbi:MAG: thioredoxin domain-containing protein [Bacteroidota bacterium]
MKLHDIAYKFLKIAKVSVSKNYLQERLESHQDYPSLRSLTDTLDELCIANFAFHVREKHRWRELDFPVLVHMHSDNGELVFRVIKDERQIKSEKEFIHQWTGITLSIKEKQEISHEEHKKHYRKEKRERVIIWAVMGILLLASLLHQLASFNWVFFVHYILSLGALLVSGTIVSYSMGVRTDISNLFCNVDTSSDCHAVLSSKLGRLGGDIGLADIALVFFFGVLVYTSFTLKGTNLVLLTFLNLLASLFTLVAIVYQTYLESWCKLCLLLTSIIWLQTANLIFHFVQLPNGISLHYIPSISNLTIFVMSMALAASWLVFKPFLVSRRHQLLHKIRIRKWRENPQWFDALLPLQRRIDDTVWGNEIFYGNPHGVLQILIVSSPFCKYCAKAHFELDQILEKHPGDIGVRIRFTLASDDVYTKAYSAVFHILNVYEELVWKRNVSPGDKLMGSIIKDWYEVMDTEKWTGKYTVQHQNTEKIGILISESLKWANSMGIHQTPSFFINGFEMPNPHTFKDVYFFISDYIEILKKRMLPVSSQ